MTEEIFVVESGEYMLGNLFVIWQSLTSVIELIENILMRVFFIFSRSRNILFEDKEAIVESWKTKTFKHAQNKTQIRWYQTFIRTHTSINNAAWKEATRLDLKTSKCLKVYRNRIIENSTIRFFRKISKHST